MDKEITYLIKFADGSEQRITVPESWKVTFGPAVRGERDGSKQSGKIPMALRFYETDSRQKAIFTDVISFRDTSIKIEEKRVRMQEKHGFMECEGARKATTFTARTEEWVNPDEIQPKIAAPSDDTMFSMDED